MRASLIVLFLFGIIITCFLIWGEWFDTMFTQEGTVAFLEQYGAWAGFAAVGLLMADLFLPLPGTIIMSATGYFYGAFWGGVIASFGSFLSGLLAYGLCRGAGEKAARRLLGGKDFARGKRLFSERGGWIVVVSRWLPMVPEIVACMAGLNRMPFPSFCLALACGSIPLGFTFAAIGAMGGAHPILAVSLSALIPIPLWLMASKLLHSGMEA
ncbi:MAG: VTT domain-containing protein [Saprospiraceae bacterium]|nr:VTT domain-containing protein [Saprospiraceae bacterium]